MLKRINAQINHRSQACDHKHIEIKQSDLPLSCPPANFRVWDAHPRVFLPIEETGICVCPYCSTKYVLIDFVPPNAE